MAQGEKETRDMEGLIKENAKGRELKGESIDLMEEDDSKKDNNSIQTMKRGSREEYYTKDKEQH